jgi:hypothetical protein
MTAHTPTDRLKPLRDFAAAQTTDKLLGALMLLERRDLTSEERLARAVMCDTIEERHGLSDAMNAIYGDDDYDGTYTEALVQALASVTA